MLWRKIKAKRGAEKWRYPGRGYNFKYGLKFSEESDMEIKTSRCNTAKNREIKTV